MGCWKLEALCISRVFLYQKGKRMLRKEGGGLVKKWFYSGWKVYLFFIPLYRSIGSNVLSYQKLQGGVRECMKIRKELYLLLWEQQTKEILIQCVENSMGLVWPEIRNLQNFRSPVCIIPTYLCFYLYI